MANNYASRIPLDESNNPMQEFATPFPAIATTVAVANISSVVTLNNNTTTIEVMASPLSAAIKWIAVGAAQTSVIASSLGTSNFDHIVPAGTVRRFVIPRETQGIAGPALANSVHGLYQRLAVVPINSAVSSILVTEF